MTAQVKEGIIASALISLVAGAIYYLLGKGGQNVTNVLPSLQLAGVGTSPVANQTNTQIPAYAQAGIPFVQPQVPAVVYPQATAPTVQYKADKAIPPALTYNQPVANVAVQQPGSGCCDECSPANQPGGVNGGYTFAQAASMQSVGTLQKALDNIRSTGLATN